jgi:uncharacterized protein YecT (DUF1311 family)
MKAFFLLVFSSLITISSQSNASDNCNNLKTQLEMNACAANEYQRDDAKLNEYYKELAEKLGPSEKERLKAAQRAWIKFRDLQCEFEASRYEGGSIQPLVRSSCLAQVTKQRNEDLRRMIEDASL